MAFGPFIFVNGELWTIVGIFVLEICMKTWQTGTAVESSDEMFEKDYGMYKNLAILSQVGLEMLVPILGSVWLGNKLGDWFGWGPGALLVCIMLGVVTAFINLFRIAMRHSKGK